MLQATISSVANVLSMGMIDDKLASNYDSGQYGVYLRVAVPRGVDPNEFVKTLNLDGDRFAAEMNFNATLGLDRLGNMVPDVESARRVLDRIIDALRAIFLGKAGKEEAKVALAQAGQEKKQDFAKIVHVDQQSFTNKKKWWTMKSPFTRNELVKLRRRLNWLGHWRMAYMPSMT